MQKIALLAGVAIASYWLARPPLLNELQGLASRYPMCRHPIWGQPCRVWEAQMQMAGENRTASEESNAMCPSHPSVPVRVQLRNECMWQPHMATFYDTSDCPVKCLGTDVDANIIVDHCEIGVRPSKPVLHGQLTLEYIGPTVEWNRPLLTGRDFFRQLRGDFQGGTLSPQHVRAFDLHVNWAREVADVYVNYMYAWVGRCGAPEDYASSSCRRPPPSRAELAPKQFAAAFISHCAPERMRYVRELNRELAKQSNGARRITHFGACDHTPGVPLHVLDKSKELERFKFTISFENSIRPSYVSEKHLEAVLANSLPVVWSSPGVEDFLPGGLGSFVFALNFSSPAQLASHLLHLDQHDDEYLQHFEWRNRSQLSREFVEQAKYNLLNRGKHGFVCRLCEAYVARYCRY